MDMLSKARAKLKLTMMSNGKIEHVTAHEIPKTWQHFGTLGDKWINVEFPESEHTSGCLYVGREKTVFDPHIHKYSDEHFMIVNPGGEIEVVTDTYIKTVKFPDAIMIPKGTPHAVIFKTETKLLVLWHPKFEGNWVGEFLEKEDK